MGYAILWASSLAAAILFVAAALAVAARSPRTWSRFFLPFWATLVPLAAGLAATVAAGFLRFYFRLDPNWFVASLAWTAGFVVGAIVLRRRGLRRGAPEAAEPAPAPASPPAPEPSRRRALVVAVLLVLSAMAFWLAARLVGSVCLTGPALLWTLLALPAAALAAWKWRRGTVTPPPEARPSRRVALVSAAVLVLSAAAFWLAIWFAKGSNLIPLAVPWTLVALSLAAAALREWRRGPVAPPLAARAWPLGRLSLALAASLLLAMAAFDFLDWKAQARLLALRAEGERVLLELAPPRLPDGENAAILYARAFEQAPPRWGWRWSEREKLKGWAEFGGLGSGVPFDPDDADLKAFLREQGAALATLRRAAAIPGCRFEGDPVFGPRLGLSGFSDAARLLSLDLRTQAARGETDLALADLAALRRMAGHVRAAWPSIIGVCIAEAYRARAAEALEWWLAAGAPPEILARLPSDEGPSAHAALARAWRGEEADFLYLLSLDLYFPPVLIPPGAPKESSLLRNLRRDFESSVSALWRVFLLPGEVPAYREFMRKQAWLLDRPYHEAFPDPASPEERLKRSSPPARPPRGMLARMQSEAKRYAGYAAEGDAIDRLTDLALAATAFRAERGAYPATLDALVPKYLPGVPLDPFDGKPLRALAHGDGLVLYSVGPDRKDDRGQPMLGFGNSDTRDDVAFCLGEAYKKYRQGVPGARRREAEKEVAERSALQQNEALVLALLKDLGDADASVRRAATAKLAGFVGAGTPRGRLSAEQLERAMKALVRATEDGDEAVRKFAVQGLREALGVGEPSAEVVAALEKRLADPSAFVRRAAEEAMKEIRKREPPEKPPAVAP